jgi:hypothetical protein
MLNAKTWVQALRVMEEVLGMGLGEDGALHTALFTALQRAGTPPN